ncbi:PSD1 and planctomycete cytochrome C domain-containing protein [Armatimonas rosea]|uniref:DUF1553 domain-containing protein n=1 Tax=Armatimonas rosea TaxID=685828 RepID=A0A7W9SLA9_ARMRO|nr:PSD1 and planctomycete cytochrome C domain-containing protein [Armatimonas rosea]MBB6048710.1 hypothetical protein [Armatimonas rosea]
MKFWLKNPPRWAGVGGAVALALAAGAQKPTPKPQALTPEQTQFFEAKIRPILTGKCAPCHVDGVARGGLSLDFRESWQRGGGSGPAVVAGDPDKSLLIQRVKSTGAPMPPGGRLSASELAALEAWVKMGAPDPRSATDVKTTSKMTGITDKARRHWAFQPVERPAIPKVKNAAWVKNPIDSFVLAKLEASGMVPTAPASRAALIRRAYYDVIGMPPTVDEVRAFLADKSPTAWEKVVDTLLASPHYGERWGRHWLDTARYSDTTGATQVGQNRFSDFRYANAWTYRDWVIGALNKDMPYNEFLMAQLAADQILTTKDDPAQLAALGFLTVGKRFTDKNDLIDERIDTVTKATMGVTVACARCHDHKFDPIPTADYYSLYGIFSSIDEPEVGPEIPGSGDPDKRADYEAQEKVLLDKGRVAYYEYVGEHLEAFQKKAAGYLMLATANVRSKEGSELAEKYGINPSNIRERDMLRILQQGVRSSKDTPQILAPFNLLQRLPESSFASQYAVAIGKMLGTAPTPAAPVGRFARQRAAQAPRAGANIPVMKLNPLVAKELASLKPRSIADVAEAYGRIFAKVGEQRAAYIEARKRNQVLSVDSATAQLIEFPLGLPPASQFSSVTNLRKLAERFRADNRAAARFPFDDLNRLQLTHPGAPGHAMVVEDVEEPKDARILIRGEKQRPGDIVPRQVFALCTPGSTPQPIKAGSGRLELARAIAAPSNPLTARVLVNRVWMHHFGAAFVRTPDDLGNMSEKPSHPELLDWLATHFMETGWSLKKLHKWILLSNTYQQGTETNAAYEKKDPANRLLWRANLRRLDFESIRDTMVALTGKLDPTLGGKPVNITDEPYIYRRSVYGYIDRLFLSDLLTQFDVSDPTMANTGRISTIVPQQALFFMNSAMAVDVARQVVAREEVGKAQSDEEKIRSIYLILYQRSPKPEEIQAGLGFLSKIGATAQGPETPAATATGKGRLQRRPVVKTPAKKGMGVGKFAPIRNNTEMVERKPLDSWELYTQALLCSNEFVYVS